jgi:AcrR family transcriptional regulator
MEEMSMRQLILQEANRLFVLQGYHAISMREISAACGISKAALYYHFRDKEALLLALLEQYLSEISEIIVSVENQNPDLRDRLLGFVRSVLEQPVNRRSLIRLGIQEFSLLSPQAQIEFGIIYQDKFISRIQSWMYAGINGGELRVQDPGLVTWIFLGMLYPFFYPSHGKDLIGADEVLIVDIFLDGAAK